MRTNKCFTLIGLLNPAEKKTLLANLKSRKGKLVALAAYLIKLAEAQKPLPENEALLLRIYKQRSSKAAEDTLRSDLRHIANAIEDLLAHKQFESKTHHQSQVHYRYHVCMALIERGEYQLFRTETTGAIKHFLQLEDYTAGALFFNLLKEHESRFAPATKDNYEQLYDELLQADATIIKSFLTQWRIHQTRKAYAETNVQIYKPGFKPLPAPDVSALEDDFPFPLLDFLKAKAQTYNSDIATRKQALIEAHKLLQQIEHPYINLPLEKLTNGVNLFTIYCLTQQAEEGFAIARQVEELLQQHTFDNRLLHIFYFNLCSMKLRYRYIEEGVQLIDKHAVGFYSSPYGTRFRFLKVYQYIFTQNADAAYAAIPDNFNPSAEDNLYIKLIETIIFYMRGQHDLCLVQIKNIKQNTDYNRFSNSTYDFFADSLLALLNAQDKSAIAAIEKEVEQFYQAQLNTPNPYLLPVVWLSWYLKQQGL